MYQLFNKRPAIVRGIVLLPEFIYIRNGLYANLLKIITFYRENPRAVPSSHFLVRLIKSITVSKHYDDRYYVDVVSDIADNLAMSLRMTSPIYTGEAFEGIFYGKGMTEILISATEDFDVKEAAMEWEDLEPIRVLSHPKTDLKINIPAGKPNGSETGIAVIAINIPMLALQYKKWVERELRVNPENPGTVMQFIVAYPLVNMIRSHLDVALFNRFNAIMNNIEPLKSRLKNPTQLISYEDKVDTYFKKLHQTLSRKHLYFDAMLASIPMISSKDALDVAALPPLIPTQQVVWAMVIAKLPFVSYVLKLDKETGGLKNIQEKNVIRRELMRLKNDKDFRRALSPQDYEIVTRHLNEQIVSYL